MLGEGSCGDFEDHGRELPGRVVVLLDAIDNPLARGEVDNTPTGDRQGDSPALGGMLTFGFDGDLRVAEDVQLPLGKCQLVLLPHLGGRRDRIEDPALGDPRFRVIRDELIPVRRDSYPRKARCRHLLSPVTKNVDREDNRDYRLGCAYPG